MRGSREKYQRKYWAVTTLLKLTNTRVWQNMAKVRSCILLNLAVTASSRMTWGRKVTKVMPASSYSTVKYNR